MYCIKNFPICRVSLDIPRLFGSTYFARLNRPDVHTSKSTKSHKFNVAEMHFRLPSFEYSLADSLKWAHPRKFEPTRWPQRQSTGWSLSMHARKTGELQSVKRVYLAKVNG